MSRLPTYVSLPIIATTLASFYFGLVSQPLWLVVPAVLALGVGLVFYLEERREGATPVRSLAVASLASFVMSLWTLVLSAIIYGFGAALDGLSAAP
ncbi:hypothetical protein [Terricaulis silvestris]|uniref:hypothetical protein n=1 Tax=Terricaulis silvestris TaxID=2686094 RepID=UPI00131B23D0|nr:hypothetical protein [Terricaulis silvestris]